MSNTNIPEIVTAKDFLFTPLDLSDKAINEQYKIINQRITIDWETLELIINVKENYKYSVDLEKCNNPAQILDCLYQVFGKPWCDASLIHELLARLEQASLIRFGHSIQGTFCPFGQPRSVVWPA